MSVLANATKAATIAGVGFLALLGLSHIVAKPSAPDCPAIQHQAAITQRAAELCTTQLVGCSLSYQEVRAVISEIDAAKACK